MGELNCIHAERMGLAAVSDGCVVGTSLSSWSLLLQLLQDDAVQQAAAACVAATDTYYSQGKRMLIVHVHVLMFICLVVFLLQSHVHICLYVFNCSFCLIVCLPVLSVSDICLQFLSFSTNLFLMTLF